MVSKRHCVKVTILCVLTCFLASKWCEGVRADYIIDSGKITGGGKVTDRGLTGMRVQVTWTDKDGNHLGSTAVKTIGGFRSGSVDFIAPKMSNGKPVADFEQTVITSNPGETSVLDVVAMTPMGTDFLVTPFAGFVLDRLGPFGILFLPDVFIEGTDTTLYSAVNLVELMDPGGPFPNGLPSMFDVDNPVTVDILNGQAVSTSFPGVSSLPGFIFGTMPIIRDPAGNPMLSDGFINPEPYTGQGVVFSEHQVSTIPEPSTFVIWSLLGLTLSGVYWMRRKPAAI